MSEKAVKRMLKKADDPYIGLMEYPQHASYRNDILTIATADEPYHKNKDPSSKELLVPQIANNARQQLKQRQRRQKQNYDKSTKPLQPLDIEESVHLRQDSIWVPAIVSRVVPTPRSYIITTPDGQQYRRNRRDLLKTNIPPLTIAKQTEDVGEEQPTVAPQPPDLHPQ